MPNCQNCLGCYLSAIFRLQNTQQFFFRRRKIRAIQLTQRLQQIFDCLLQRIGIHAIDAIAQGLHLLTLLRQVIEGLQMLHIRSKCTEVSAAAA
ncbi:hypothetical protein [Atlanticothrix silvestris]|uniref:hypothetical protein n=1 Tax=Atlanticothrix silvestris TaxID=2840444 RepID=UPI001BDBDEF6|nr:hypothetical protein [Atlanticothrix silvestris]